MGLDKPKMNALSFLMANRKNINSREKNESSKPSSRVKRPKLSLSNETQMSASPITDRSHNHISIDLSKEEPTETHVDLSTPVYFDNDIMEVKQVSQTITNNEEYDPRLFSWDEDKNDVIVLSSDPMKDPKEEECSIVDVIEKPETKIKANQSSHPFFQSIKQKFQNSSATKEKAKSRKQRDLLLLQEHPFLKRSQFINKALNTTEINDHEKLYNGFKHDNFSFPNRREVEPTNFSDVNEFMELYRAHLKASQYITDNSIQYETSPIGNVSFFDCYENLNDLKFKRLTENQYPSTSISIWSDVFRPTSSSEILQSPGITKQLHRWINDSFGKLKTVDKQKRRKLLKGKKLNEIDAFIVQEFEEQQEDGFVPSLIIEGPTGCGKTSAVYAIIAEHYNGHIFELNSSQSRAKKDIEFHLKQIGTTTTVDEVQNSVILFDDVDLIDEESIDRDFWQGIFDLLSYTFRPVIFTTNDVSKIPKKIVSQSKIITFRHQNKDVKREYLDLVAMNQDLKLDQKTLDWLSKFDLRRSIMELQMITNKIGSTERPLQIREMKPSVNFTPDPNTNLPPLEYLLLKYESESWSINRGDKSIKTTIFDNMRSVCLEFYSSKKLNSKSRLKFEGVDPLTYVDNYLDFSRLPKSELAAYVLPLIKQMARDESIRQLDLEEYDTHRQDLSLKTQVLSNKRFGHDPNSLFKNL